MSVCERNVFDAVLFEYVMGLQSVLIMNNFMLLISYPFIVILAVRADRMRGGRNKFGPMYKRDRARKLQIIRQRQLALQALRGQMGGQDNALSLSQSSYQTPYSSMQIKQEIQIPQVSVNVSKLFS